MVQRADSAARRRYDMRELKRVGLWGLATTAALVVAVFVATSETGERRLIQALVSFQGLATTQSSRVNENETRKLTDAVKSLTADRDALTARLSVLERNIGEITGSIARPAPATAPSQPTVALLPTIAPPDTGPAPQIPTEPARPEFGIDLGTAINVEGLRAIWAAARTRHGGLLDTLRPVVAIRETGRPGGVELRLVAGPLGSATAAAKLCSVITSTGALCQPAVFDGQRLALR